MMLVEVKDLHPSRSNVRADLGDLHELAASIRAHNLLQPLVVRERSAGGWEVIDGHRRLAAAKLIGVKRLPCLVSRAARDDQVVSMMLAAAMHKGLDPLEQARAFRALRDDSGLTDAEIGQRTGYSKRTVAARLLLLELPDEAQDLVATKRITVTEATDLARQVVKKRTGSASAAVKRSTYLNASHRLAAAARGLCDHKASRVAVGSVACGQCWEQTIRNDATQIGAPA